jgi:DNA-binding transcriptional LysR family regulator
MSNLPFTLRQLEVFSSLCETRSFRKSAESLGISQASTSNQLKVLEEQLGISLFVRNAGLRPSLTPEGTAFLEDLQAFNKAAHALARHRRADPVLSGPVRFKALVGQGLSENFIRPKLAEFLADHPQIDLVFDVEPPNYRMPYRLEEGDYDFAMFHLREDRAMPPDVRPLATVHGGVYGHSDFANGRPLPLTPDEIADLPFLLPRAGSNYEREVVKALERHAIRPRKVIGNFQYFDAMVAMLDRGTAVASFTDAMIRPELRRNITLLFPMDRWRLAWFRRKSNRHAIERAEIERFMIESVLSDPNYTTIERAELNFL